MLLLKFGFKPKEFYAAAMTQVLVLNELNLRARLMIFVPVGILMIGCIIFMGLYFARFNSVANIQKIAEDNVQGFDSDLVYYDITCSTSHLANPVIA